MAKVRVGVAGYGTIGQRLADGVAMQEDMELVGIADLAPTLAIRALRENDMIGANGVKYNLYLVNGADRAAFDAKDIPVAGTFEELCSKVDIMLDSAPGGVGAKNKVIYEKMGVKAIFQGGEKNSVADVFFHGYANYEKGLGQNYLKLTSCNTTGLIRTVDCLDRAYGVDKVAITIIRRVADPGDYHRGLTNALQIDKAPSHQAVDLMTIMPHVQATGILVHTPVTHGHIITVLASGKDGCRLPGLGAEAHRAAFFPFPGGNPHSDLYLGISEPSDHAPRRNEGRSFHTGGWKGIPAGRACRPAHCRGLQPLPHGRGRGPIYRPGRHRGHLLPRR